MPRRRSNLAVVVALGALGTLGAVSTVGVSPSLQGAQTPQLSAQARAHLVEIIGVFERRWLYRSDMDWDGLRASVLEKAGGAQTIPDTDNAIRLALTLLGDKHSFYISPSGEYISNPESPIESTGQCTPSPVVAPVIPADVGYVRIGITTPAEVLQDVIRSGDRTSPIGWIVDLRNLDS